MQLKLGWMKGLDLRENLIARLYFPKTKIWFVSQANQPKLNETTMAIINGFEIIYSKIIKISAWDSSIYSIGMGPISKTILG